MNRPACETRTEAFRVPRYGETIAQAEALSAQAALPARTQEVVASWLDYHARCQEICRQIREWPARLDALAADCPERPAKLDANADWRQRAEPLPADARAMLAEDAPPVRHLAARPDERKALAEGTGRLDRALVAVEAREMDVLSTVAQRWAEKIGGIAFDSRAYAALMERALPRRQAPSAGRVAQRSRRHSRKGRRLVDESGQGPGIPRAGRRGREGAALRKDMPQHELAAIWALPALTRTRSVSAKRRFETGSPKSRKSRPPCE